jgi:hypothetical protein
MCCCFLLLTTQSANLVARPIPRCQAASLSIVRILLCASNQANTPSGTVNKVILSVNLIAKTVVVLRQMREPGRHYPYFLGTRRQKN